ncbi:hypothetical protein BJ878DRAFT_533833 [Calycina marina]|uniref:RRM domain-containing protein n=1 Tax=Calycina marina TaxID=1763456 RepID=A0A9P7Z545_9HELO|nr:hypothetical protein BJ878DRAFT_533833 [Calycina marina]
MEQETPPYLQTDSSLLRSLLLTDYTSQHFVRRAALRAASSAPSTSFISKSRSINTSSPFALRPKVQQSIAPSVFRRFASDDAEAPSERDPEANPFASSRSRDSGYVARDGYRSPLQDRVLAPTTGVYVGNLLFDVTSADLQKEFAAYGTIKSAIIAQDARGLSKGFGYVEFSDVSEATAAIEARHQTIMEGRRLIVNYMAKTQRENKISPPSKTLFIGNLAFEMSDADLNKLFRDIRNVIDVRVAIDRRTGQPRGFAHADFVDIDSAEKAMAQLSGKDVYGRQLRVDFSAGARESRAPRGDMGDSSSGGSSPF